MDLGTYDKASVENDASVSVPASTRMLESAAARSVVQNLRSRFQVSSPQSLLPNHAIHTSPAALLKTSEVDSVDDAGDQLSVSFSPGIGAAHHAVSLGLPSSADSSLKLKDIDSGVSITAQLQTAAHSPAELADGYVVYRGALGQNFDLVYRPSQTGIEDFMVFEDAPANASIAYEIVLGNGVAGARLVSNTFELLDGTGTPRLRVAPPFLVDHTGAVHDASIKVTGCAFSTDGSPPWGKPVTPPSSSSCTLTINWNNAEVAYPAVLDPSWSSTGQMTNARYFHAASVWGSYVLVTGGIGTSGAPLPTTDIYNPAGTGSWSAGVSMNLARAEHSQVTIPDGNVLVVGGYGTSSSAYTTGEVLHFAVSHYVWTQSTTSYSHRMGVAVSLAPQRNNEVLVCGGYDSSLNAMNGCEIYSDNSSPSGWRTATTNMTYGRVYPTATLFNNNSTVIVAGGYGRCFTQNCLTTNADLGSTETLDVTQITNTTTPAFSFGPNISARDSYTAVAFNSGANVLIAGGYNNSTGTTLGTAQIYASGAWSSPVSYGANTADGLASVLMANGDVMVLGGYSATNGYLAEVDLYDALAGTWHQASSMAYSRYLNPLSSIGSWPH